MLRLLTLLGLPFGVYVYWRYFANASAEERARRAQAVVSGVIALVIVAVSLRRGSLVSGVLGVVLVGLLNWFQQKRQALPSGARPGPSERPRSSPPPSRSGSMTQSEALEILGLSPGASRSEINQRYKKLMLGVHPDQGGSSYLATQLNRARAVLLEGSQS